VHPVLLERFLRGCHRVGTLAAAVGARQVLAVGQHHDRAAGARLRREALAGQLDGVGQRRAAARAAQRAQVLQRRAHRAVVQGERHLQRGSAGEFDQPDAVAAQALDRFLDELPRAHEAVRRRVLRQHRAADVHHEEHLGAAAADFLDLRAPSRVHHRQHQRAQAEQRQHRPHDGPRQARPRRDRGQQRGVGEGLHRPRAAAQPHHGQQGQRQHQPQPVQRAGVREHELHRVHGSVLQRVRPSATSAATSTSTIASSGGNRRPATSNGSTAKSRNCR
jgi:hypothetical protein